MSDEGYLDDYIVQQRIAEELACRESAPTASPDVPRTYRRGDRGSGDDVEASKGLISAKTVFYIVVFTALVTAVVNPSLLVVTLPVATLVSSMLALAKRGRKREPRRIGDEW
jgi:hypothetical protein